LSEKDNRTHLVFLLRNLLLTPCGISHGPHNRHVNHARHVHLRFSSVRVVCRVSLSDHLTPCTIPGIRSKDRTPKPNNQNVNRKIQNRKTQSLFQLSFFRNQTLFHFSFFSPGFNQKNNPSPLVRHFGPTQSAWPATLNP
jgi:hypothetical protein